MFPYTRGSLMGSYPSAGMQSVYCTALHDLAEETWCHLVFCQKSPIKIGGKSSHRVIIIIILFTNPSARAGFDTRSILKRSLTGLNSKFSFSYTSCLTKAEEPSLPYYLPIAGGRIIGFKPSPRVLELCKMQDLNSCLGVHFLWR